MKQSLNGFDKDDNHLKYKFCKLVTSDSVRLLGEQNFLFLGLSIFSYYKRVGNDEFGK